MVGAVFFVGAIIVGEKKSCERAELVAWATAQTADDEFVLKRRFDRCRELRIEEAIVIAAIYAGAPEEDGGDPQWHVIAAKDYLRSFTRSLVERRITEEIKNGDNARSLIRGLSEIWQ